MKNKSNPRNSLKHFALALSLVWLSGCASGPGANPADPLEPLNRAVFNFNEGVDKAVLKPVATAYQDVTPSPVRTGVRNFFENLSDAWSMVNNLLQAKPKEAVDSLFRVTTNSFWGVAGLFDVASVMGIPKHKEDFGQTLGVWGVASGPYVVLPVLGPSSVRDTVGTVVDSVGSVVPHVENVPTRNSLIGLRAVDTRANLLGVGDVLDQAALDKYTFTRDIYLQRRRSQVGREDVQPEERYDLPETAPATGAPAKPAPQTP